MKIGVIGPIEFVIGFRLAGIRNTFVIPEDVDLAGEITRVTSEEELGILIAESGAVQGLPDDLRLRLTESIQPVLVTVGLEPDTSLREKVRRAIGIDLYKED